MVVTIRDDTWNMLNMQHIIPNLKRWDYSDIPGGGHNRLKDPPTWLKVATTLEKPPTPTHNKVWWQCLVPTSTTRFASDVGYRMAKM